MATDCSPIKKRIDCIYTIISIYPDDSKSRPKSVAGSFQCSSLVDQIERPRSRLQTVAGKGSLKASAVIYVTSIQDRNDGQMRDAVTVSLIHRDELSTIVNFPYELDGGTPDWGATFRQAGHSDIFQ